MSQTVIKVENLGKLYRLGEVGTGTISHDLNRWWARVRGKEDPFAKIGQVNDRTTKGSSDYVWALKNVAFEVKQGEVLGIIGRNGAGKSTLLKILSKVTAPTTGSIKVKGRIASLLEVGTGFHPELTGRENIYLNGAILGMTRSEIRSKFDEIVDFAGVERYIDTPVKRYSSGMYVRLAFAVAAFLEPEILIVDEVLAVGDAEFQKKCLGRMKDVSQGEGKTVIFVSHSMSAIRTLCTHSVVLANGVVAHDGAVETAVQLYNSNLTGKKTAYYKSKTLKGEGIVEIYMINASGYRIECIQPDVEFAYICFKVELVNPYSVSLGFTVFNSDGIPLFSAPVAEGWKTGANEKRIRIPVNLLKGGEYHLEGALWNSDGTIEQNDCYLKFMVDPKNKLEIIGAGLRGIIYNPNIWE